MCVTLGLVVFCVHTTCAIILSHKQRAFYTRIGAADKGNDLAAGSRYSFPGCPFESVDIVPTCRIDNSRRVALLQQRSAQARSHFLAAEVSAGCPSCPSIMGILQITGLCGAAGVLWYIWRLRKNKSIDVPQRRSSVISPQPQELILGEIRRWLCDHELC